MKYWGANELINNGRLRQRHRRDIKRLLDVGVPLPDITLVEIHQIMHAQPACTSLVTIRSEGCPLRLVYLEHPTQENWLALERNGFLLTDETFGFMTDALH